MLEFKVVLDKSGAQSYLEGRNVPTALSGLMVMTATEGGKTVGMGAVSMNPARAVLEELVCDDDTIAYGMGKAVLNTLDLGGIGKVVVQKQRLFPLAKRLRFVENSDGFYEVELEGYFTAGCEK